MNNELIIPNHIGIIMDGNGRWAVDRGLTRTMGHKKAVSTLKELCIHMADIKIPFCSLYAFSTENFKRDKKEVDYLMNLFITVFQKEFSFLKEKNIKVLFSGRDNPLPKDVLVAMNKIMNDTKDNTGLVLNICINYGSVSEIEDMVKKICCEYKNGDINIEDINSDYILKNMYQDLPMLDFVIRTSGEQRLSNFMLYQASYAEFYFPKVYFPDFDNNEFDKAIEEFNRRNRRFGGIK